MSRTLSALLLFLPCAIATLAGGARVAAEDNHISHGPMLGHVTDSSIRVWARTARPGEFVVRYGTESNALDQASAPVNTVLSRDCTGSVVLKNLQPRTLYYYQVQPTGGGDGVEGSFRTLPSSQRMRHTEHNPRGLYNFRFEFACGNNQNPKSGIGPSLPTYTTMNREIRNKIDFAILNGDWLYEEHRDYSLNAWKRQLGVEGEAPKMLELTPTQVGVWENYKTYLARAGNLAEWHRHVPSYFTFDDHELVNDIYGSGEVGRRDRRAVFRDIALAAWYDYLGWANPTAIESKIHLGRAKLTAGSDVLTDTDADFTRLDRRSGATLHVHWGGPHAGMAEFEYDSEPGDPNAGVYEVVEVLDRQRLRIRPPARATGTPAYSIGRASHGSFRVANCEFYLLDTRTHRQMHDVREPAKPGVSMLGRRQLEWLKESMRRSDADFFFIVSSVNFMIPHVGAGGVEFDTQNKDDAWTTFLHEREELIEFWDGLRRPVLVLTGDLHNSFAIKITDRVWEFASGPHNSVNHGFDDEGDRPATGRYQWGPRPCEIRWSSYVLTDVPRSERLHPYYCVVQVNNVFNSPTKLGEERWIAYPQPQVIFQYYHGRSGELAYAESVSLTAESPVVRKEWNPLPQGSEK